MPPTESIRPIERLGAVVLCGGKSTRLGMDKAQLIFDGQTFLERVVRRVEQACGPIVLVGDSDLTKHKLPSDISIVSDEQTEKGPLEGIRVGLRHLSKQVQYAFVTSCDVPLLKPELIRHLFSKIGNHQAVVPIQTNRVFGTTAIYRTELHDAIGRRIAQEQFRVSDLASEFSTNQIDVESLKIVDPDLDSLTNVNSANDYFQLLKRFGFECPTELADKIGYSGA